VNSLISLCWRHDEVRFRLCEDDPTQPLPVEQSQLQLSFPKEEIPEEPYEGAEWYAACVDALLIS
jgi:hypothetical protein